MQIDLSFIIVKVLIGLSGIISCPMCVVLILLLLKHRIVIKNAKLILIQKANIGT
jgi:hypothetical protein